jgi:hypothetical protein
MIPHVSFAIKGKRMSRKRRKTTREPGVGGGLTLALFSREDFRDVLRDRLLSRRWWTFLSVGGMGLDFLNAVERKHYWGKANKFFEMSILSAIEHGLGILNLTFASKHRMTVRQLASHFDVWGLLHQAEALARDPNADIIIMVKPAELGMRAGMLLQALAGIEE